MDIVLPFGERMPQCTAKSKQSGERCRRNASIGYSVCAIHGGKTPRGEKASRFVDGRHSLYYLPTKLQKIASEIPAEFDKDILARNTLLTEAFIRQKLETLEDAPDSREAWEALRKDLDKLIEAFSNENYGAVAVRLDSISRLVDERILYHLSVGEIRRDLAEQRANQKAIADIEFKGQNAIPVSQLVKFLLSITEIAAAVISNPKERYALFDGIDRLIGANAPAMIEAKNE
jgi:hypothetical protein